MAELESKTIHSVAKAIHLLDLLTAGGQPRVADRAVSENRLAEEHDPRAAVHDA